MKIKEFFLLLITTATIVTAEEKKIVVIIPSYNNSAYYKKNLASVFTQKYENYEVVYIDDCSSDSTGNLVEVFIAQSGQQQRCTLIKNSSRLGALANIYTAVHNCADNVIIANLDGDDWFAHNHVLQTINNAYADPEVWLTYGQYKRYPSGLKGHCKPLPEWVIYENSYREYSWRTSALRTFYAGLFKKINKNDLMHNGDFFPVAWDLAYMFPMLEMSGGRFVMISDVVYIYNRNNVINDNKVAEQKQKEMDIFIRRKPKYSPLAELNCAH